MPDWFDEEQYAATPPERISVSEWASRYRVLGAHSAIKGPYRLDMVPFFVPVMDWFADLGTDEVVVAKSAQIGGTDAFVNVVGYYLDQDPSSILMVLADQDTAEYVVKEKVEVMLKSSPRMLRIYDEKTFTKSGVRTRNGGYLAPAWASSVAKLASKPIRIVILDEVDKPGYSLSSQEAGAISLAKERTNTFPEGHYKHGILSTPTLEHGNIISALNNCDIIYDWHVPCPECGQHQPLRWSNDPKHCYGLSKGYRGDDGEMHKLGSVVWDGGGEATANQIRDTARYKCGECGALWDTIQKNDAVRRGKIVPRAEETGHERRRGFHINRIYSLFDGGRIEKLVEQWVSIQRNPNPVDKKEALQGFINSGMAEPWMIYQKSMDQSSILNLCDERQRGAVPPGVAAVVAGVDTQKDGFWYEIRAIGYGLEAESWQIREGFVDSLEGLEQVLFSDEYEDSEGKKYIVQLAVQDAMGGTVRETEGYGTRTAEVYDFCRKHRGRILPAKGELRMNQPYAFSEIEYYPGGTRKIPGGLKLVRHNTTYYKNAVSTKLDIAPADPGAWHYHAETSDNWAKQMTAEFLNDQGVWECPPGRDNHAFDCSCLTLVAADILGVRFWKKKNTAVSEPPAPQKKIESETPKTSAGYRNRPSWFSRR